MTPKQFKAWRDDLKLTQQEAADALGLSRSTVINYETGVRRDGGGDSVIPKSVALACLAIKEGLGEDKFSYLDQYL